MLQTGGIFLEASDCILSLEWKNVKYTVKNVIVSFKKVLIVGLEDKQSDV